MAKKKSSKSGRLHVQRVFHAPLQELSGICLRRGKNHERSLVAVGDGASTVAWVALPEGRDWSPEWHTVDLSRLAGSELPADDPQLEAVCADGAGRVLFLQEFPPRVELVDPESKRVVAPISLEMEGDDELALSWSDRDGSHGEGAVMLPGGHLLVAKEKGPAALIEFGPPGAESQGLAPGGALADGEAWPVEPGDQRFVALAAWFPGKKLRKVCDDFSDLEIGPDGQLYLLSDQSASIVRLDDLPPGGGKARPTAAWQIDDVDGKPEGLAFSATGCAVVALDTRKARNNLVLLEPAIANARGD
jgi:hypothetical protein